VIAGGRRLEAIRSLQAEGKLSQDYAVPCQIVTEDYALEMSLAENTIRLAMHPADQFQTFAELIDKGATAAEVAQRFGVDESLVYKRMKLARVAPELLDEYRNDGMTLECLMAYTITDDHRRQRKVFKSLQDWQKDDPDAIRNALTEKMIEANDKLARFVGLEAYTAAGGISRADLFGDEVYLEKPALLHKLAEKKFDGIRIELEAEGWNWIEINPERDWNLVNRCSRIKPMLLDAPSELLDLKAKLDVQLEEIESAIDDADSDEFRDQEQELRDRVNEVEEQLLPFVNFDPDQKALAGCFVSIGQDGSPFIDKGLVKPEHRKQLATLLGTEDSSVKPTNAKPKGALSSTLQRDLAEVRLRIAQVEIAKHPLIALDLLMYQTALSMIDDTSADEALDIEFNRTRLKEAADTATGDFEAVAKSLSLEWLKVDGDAARFETFRLLPETAKLEILAYCVALTLAPKLGPVHGEEATAYDVTLALTAGRVADYWRPTDDGFLGRLTREQLLAVSREVLGDSWSQSHSGDKKALLVEQLHRAFADPDKSGRTSSQVEKLKGWLPAGMSFDILSTKKTATKKLRKAA
jgi:ParB family chromosome partitioning protein